jgi:hypothetical protein
VLNRRLATSLIALGLAGLAVAGCADQAAAVRVDDRTMSRSDFEEHLDALYEDDDLRTVVFGGVARSALRPEDAPEGTYTQQYVGGMASLHASLLAVEQLLDDEGIELTDDDRDAARQELAERTGLDPDQMRGAAWDVYVDGFAGITRLADELGGQEEAQDAIDAVLTEADVSVSSQYGSWDPDTLRVTPPPGPRGDGGTGSFVG